jgi:fumarylacetoacetase
MATAEPWGFDLDLEVWLESAAMRAAGLAPVRLSRTSFADMYWTPAQQLAHMTVNGASVHPGDLFASGTVSGPTRGSEGSLIELAWRGERPVELPDGTTRAFLHDGDRVELRGWAGRDPASRIGLGSVSGTIVGSPPTRGAS